MQTATCCSHHTRQCVHFGKGLNMRAAHHTHTKHIQLFSYSTDINYCIYLLVLSFNLKCLDKNVFFFFFKLCRHETLLLAAYQHGGKIIRTASRQRKLNSRLSHGSGNYRYQSQVMRAILFRHVWARIHKGSRSRSADLGSNTPFRLQ